MSSNTGNTVSIAPLMAPLSRPIMVHLANYEKVVLPTVTTDMDEQLVTAGQRFRARWYFLSQQVQEKREEAFHLMSPVVQGRLLSTEWLIETLTQYTPGRQHETSKPLTAQTISRWREQGLLRYEQKNQPDSECTAAIVTARMIDPRERGWLPPTIAADEPLWWCWRQDSPTDPVIPSPVPLPENIPHHALLWTNWRGAAWKQPWLPLGNLGAARWGGTMVENGNVLWNLTVQEMELWDAEIMPLGNGVLDSAAKLTRHTLATLALLRLATPRLQQAAHPTF